MLLVLFKEEEQEEDFFNHTLEMDVPLIAPKLEDKRVHKLDVSVTLIESVVRLVHKDNLISQIFVQKKGHICGLFIFLYYLRGDIPAPFKGAHP